MEATIVMLVVIIIVLLLIMGYLTHLLKEEGDEKFECETRNIHLERRNKVLERICREYKENNTNYSNDETVALLIMLCRTDKYMWYKNRLDEHKCGDAESFYVYLQLDKYCESLGIAYYKWKIEIKYWDMFYKAQTLDLVTDDTYYYCEPRKLLELI